MDTQQPVLTPRQEASVFHAAALRVASIVTKVRSRKVAELIPEIARMPVLGAFVSLKKNGHLRACMGALGDSMPLAEAVEAAAVRSAKDDPRFPPIVTAELAGIDMEVWILWGMKQILAHGKARADEIEIGRHGLQIIQGANRGLLLPGVATEFDMDVPEFLEAVCRKAGLPGSAWYDERSMLLTFEGRSIAGAFADVRIEEPEILKRLEVASRFQWNASAALGPTLAEVEQLRQICGRNLLALFEGGRPGDFHPGQFDGTVSGISVIVEIAGRPLLVCSKITLRPEVSLQSSLSDMLRLMAEQIEHAGATRLELTDARLDLAVFWDPRMHGNVVAHDLSGVETATRSMMISSPEGWIAQYRPQCTPEELLKDSVDYLKITEPATAEVLSMETVCTASKVLVTNMSKRDDFPPRRPCAVAGSFYPNEPAKLEAALDDMFASGRKKYALPPKDEEKAAAAHPGETGKDGPVAAMPIAGSPLAGSPIAGSFLPGPIEASAVLVPHAGWVYSGELAAATLRRVRIPSRVIIFSPKHRPGGLDWAVAPYRTWELPGDALQGDPDFAAKMLVATDLFQFDPVPHAEEHAIEVQLPLLRRLRPDVRVIGVTLATASWPLIADSALQLAAFLMSQPEWPLLIISSDLHHYGTEEMTRVVDRMAIDEMLRRDPENLLAVVRENRISMCGVTAAALVLETLCLCDRLNESVLVGHTTSAERTGDTDRVVGYAGMIFN